MFYDAHNHLASGAFAPHEAEIFADLTSAGVERAVVNGTEEADWPRVARLARTHPLVLPSYGLHPWETGNRSSTWLDSLRAHLVGDPLAAVGEIGLDRWMLDRARSDDPRLVGLRRAPLDEQLVVFNAQLQLAAELNRPATVHCIDAFGLLLETLQRARDSRMLPPRFLLHAYSGAAELVRNFQALGAYFSFNAAYLAPRHQRLREVFRIIPFDRLVVETDAPAMRPPANCEKFPALVGADGTSFNHPANLPAAYAGLANLRTVAPETLKISVEENFFRLFPSASAKSLER